MKVYDVTLLCHAPNWHWAKLFLHSPTEQEIIDELTRELEEYRKYFDKLPKPDPTPLAVAAIGRWPEDAHKTNEQLMYSIQKGSLTELEGLLEKVKLRQVETHIHESDVVENTGA